MFGAMTMSLQAQPTAGIDFQALGLEPRAFLNHCEAAPRAAHSGVHRKLGSRVLGERFHYVSDLLTRAPARDKNCVARLDDTDVFQPDGRDNSVIAANKRVATLEGHDI